MPTGPEFGMLRVALLSVAEAERLVAAGNVEDPLVTTCIRFAASPQLLERASAEERAGNAVLRYVSRMGGRATPYGLFAGTACATVGDERRIELDRRSRHHVRVRVDFGVLDLLVHEAVRESDRRAWPLRRNPTLRRAGDGLRFAQAGGAGADVVTVREVPAITALLEVLGDGVASAEELADALAARMPAASPEALHTFVARLVDGGILHRATGLIGPGTEPAALASAVLGRVGDRARAGAVTALSADVCGDHPLDPGLGDRLNKGWEAATRDVPALRDLEENRRFQLDLGIATTSASVDRATVDELDGALRRLELMFPAADPLAGVRETFRGRYGDAEVPLLEALDLENGILPGADRYASRLARMAGVESSGPGEPPAPSPVQFEALRDWLKEGRPVDLAGYPAAARGSVSAVHAALLDEREGGYRSLLMAGYRRTSTAVLSRFALGDDELTARMRAWVADDDPGAPIHAELVYAPGGRVGNQLLRPRLFEEQISLTGAAGGSLRLDRLLVGLDGDTWRLRDRVSGREVIVELSSAHNVLGHGLDPIYRFLAAVVSPGSLAWRWGPFLELPHLPRVTCGRTIVSAERWRLTGGEVEAVLGAAEPDAVLRGALPGLGERRWVGVGESDQLLPVDTWSARSIRACLAAGDSVTVVELPQVERPAATGPDGRHVSEVVVPLRARRTPLRRPGPVAVHDPSAGSSWVYVRYYAGPAAADAVVGRAARAVGGLMDRKVAAGWYFTRDDDRGQHVGIRVRPEGEGRRDTVLAALAGLGRELRAEGLVTRVMSDDHVPEVARFGGPACLARAEELFHADSAAVARFLATSPGEEARLYEAVSTALAWCSLWFGGHEDRHGFLRERQAGLGLSGASPDNRIGRFHREHRAALDAYLAGAVPDPRPLEALGSFREAVQAQRDILGAVLRLHFNRLFRFDAGRLEFLAYELAVRKLRELMARERCSSPSPSP
ncbi:thiopeptide-type bacteriocin biosynthesis protein [Nonomuraea rubra]|uniref:Thiopeptide-type bacteriocin biosynthesis protein n=1 Tax=Nonomuraea rubra TaxID=46180 RepID=A0A7X0NPM7_9ACTN|nr:thiopeptide-type bacteriocin biosynthesis protein [Nonomuraea rubra]MBB6547271.1 thiopeptide-type bacteriocin biosynthesis protein [Nonomuraea rubra]